MQGSAAVKRLNAEWKNMKKNLDLDHYAEPSPVPSSFDDDRKTCSRGILQ